MWFFHHFPSGLRNLSGYLKFPMVLLSCCGVGGGLVFFTGVKFRCLPTWSGFRGRNVGLRFLLHVGLLVLLRNVVVRVQVLHIRFGGYIHLDRGCFVNSPTWIIFQMRFVFEKQHVWTFNYFLCLQAFELKHLGAFVISEKQALDALHVQLRSPLI